MNRFEPTWTALNHLDLGPHCFNYAVLTTRILMEEGNLREQVEGIHK